MKVITAENVHVALPLALQMLEQIGVERESRNGPVLVAPCPVTTVYHKPLERVLFYPERDANPFFHLYESLWMLAGREDVAGVARYVPRMADFSDDGSTFHGAYGYRWRHHFCCDQLTIIAEALKNNPDDRRCMLQMWCASSDLGAAGKDFPCNTMASFQRGVAGELNMTVFCRSNDIILGAYGANAVHFSMLLEYMALMIGCPVGSYTQVSVNWHAYKEMLGKVATIRPDRLGFVQNPYGGYLRGVHPVPMRFDFFKDTAWRAEGFDNHITELLRCADTGEFNNPPLRSFGWSRMVWSVLRAHHLYKNETPAKRFSAAHAALVDYGDPFVDWIVAAREWLERRERKTASLRITL